MLRAKYNPVMRRVFLAALLLGPALRAADSPEQLNKLNVIALDVHGQPVTDLSTADFQISDDGKARTIVWSRFIGTKSARTPLGPREYSNRSGASSHMITVLFDMLNDRLLGDAVVRSEIVEALKDLESSDNVYLYLLSPRGELFPVHPIPPPDTQVKPQTEPWTRQIASLLDQAMKPLIGFHQVDELDIKNRYQETVTAIGDLGGRMMESSGPRYLVWVTHGFPIYGYSMSVRARIDFTNPLRDFYQRLETSQILLYPVDQSQRGAGADPTSYSTQTLDEATALTGGRRLTSDRVNDGIQQAMTDSRADYQIVYQVPKETPDKKRHKLRVTTTRKDVRIQSAEAYYALPPSTPESLERTALERAIHSPFEATDIGLRASVEPIADSKNVTLTVRVDPADLLLLPSGENRTGHFQLVVAFYDANGARQVSNPVSFNLNLTPQQIEVAAHGGVTLHQTAVLDESIRRIAVIVYDPALNATGSVNVPVKP